MEKNPEFDDIRPFYDDEVSATIARLLDNPRFQFAGKIFFTDNRWKQEEQVLRSFTNLLDFQRWIAKSVVFEILDRSADELTCSGMDRITETSVCTYISNHRDIVLDAAILGALLVKKGLKSVEIAIGDNLLFSEWIRDTVRLNRSFIVKRDLPMRQMLEAAIHLSKYISYTIQTKKHSIWIAQREGRAKDSNDRTQESVLKMMAIGGGKDFLRSLADLNLTPTTYSYEFDPCDFLKAKEFQQRRDNPDFKKSMQDDLLNMKTGIFGYKGRIHVQVGQTINNSLSALDNSLGKNELVKEVVSIIDKEIFRNYKFYPINYIAYDRLWGNNLFSDKYSSDDVKKFELYFQQQLDKIDLPEKDIPYLTERMEEMYANPVKNNYETTLYE